MQESPGNHFNFISEKKAKYKNEKAYNRVLRAYANVSDSLKIHAPESSLPALKNSGLSIYAMQPKVLKNFNISRETCLNIWGSIKINYSKGLKP